MSSSVAIDDPRLTSSESDSESNAVVRVQDFLQAWAKSKSGNIVYDGKIFAGCLPWISEIEEELEQIKSLEQGWDSYNGSPIDRDLILKALDLVKKISNRNIPQPHIVPVGNGGLNIEWRFSNRLVSIKLRKDGITYLLANRLTNKKLSGHIVDENNLDELLTSDI